MIVPPRLPHGHSEPEQRPIEHQYETERFPSIPDPGWKVEFNKDDTYQECHEKLFAQFQYIRAYMHENSEFVTLAQRRMYTTLHNKFINSMDNPPTDLPKPHPPKKIFFIVFRRKTRNPPFAHVEPLWREVKTLRGDITRSVTTGVGRFMERNTRVLEKLTDKDTGLIFKEFLPEDVAPPDNAVAEGVHGAGGSQSPS